LYVNISAFNFSDLIKDAFHARKNPIVVKIIVMINEIPTGKSTLPRRRKHRRIVAPPGFRGYTPYGTTAGNKT
jgi:hypothetical protein